MRYLLLLFTITTLLLSAFIYASFPGYNVSRAQTVRDNSTNLATLESQIEQTAHEYQAITVSVIASRDIARIRECQNSQDGLFDLPLLEGIGDIFRQCTIQHKTQQVSGGSGFVVRSDGIIATNKHVVSDPSLEYTVVFDDNSEQTVERIIRSSSTDIALLKINKSNLPAARLSDSSPLNIGQFVLAMGNALGEFENSVSFGIISGLNRSITAFSQNGGDKTQLSNVIQTDAAINLGNSGGPLINLRGEVIGVNTATAQGAENIGFAIPINEVTTLLNRF